MTHTPGPWLACEPGAYSDFDGHSSVILGDDRRIAVVQGDHEEAVANAHLIAAAPDMLAALEQLLEAFNENANDLNDIPADQAVAMMESAIAKATGDAS